MAAPDLPAAILADIAPAAAPDPAALSYAPSADDQDAARLVRYLTHEALRRAHGNQAEAATIIKATVAAHPQARAAFVRVAALRALRDAAADDQDADARALADGLTAVLDGRAL